MALFLLSGCIEENDAKLLVAAAYPDFHIIDNARDFPESGVVLWQELDSVFVFPGWYYDNEEHICVFARITVRRYGELPEAVDPPKTMFTFPGDFCIYHR